jgi:hypothetical protein
MPTRDAAKATPWLPGIGATPETPHAREPNNATPLLSPTKPNEPFERGIERIAPNIISVGRWAQLLDGRLLATSPRVDWATLLRRTHGVDVFQCAKCGGRMRVVEVVSDKHEAAEAWRAIQAGERPEPRARAPSRAPPGQLELPWARA